MESVRQLTAMTDKLLKGGLTVDGNLKVTGILDNKWITDTLSTNYTTFQTNYTTFETKINKAIKDMNLSKYIKYDDPVYLWSRANTHPYDSRIITLVTPVKQNATLW